MKATKLQHRASYTRHFTDNGWYEYVAAQTTEHIAQMAHQHGIKHPEFLQYLTRKMRRHACAARKNSTRA